MTNRLHGAIAASVTPLKDGGRTLDADAIARNAAHGEGFGNATMANADDRAFKLLDTLAFTFLNTDMNGNGIARTQVRDIGIDGSFNGFQQVGHFLCFLTRMKYCFTAVG